MLSSLLDCWNEAKGARDAKITRNATITSIWYPPPCPRHQWSVSINVLASLWMSGRVPLRAGQDGFWELPGAVAWLFFTNFRASFFSMFFFKLLCQNHFYLDWSVQFTFILIWVSNLLLFLIYFILPEVNKRSIAIILIIVETLHVIFFLIRFVN